MKYKLILEYPTSTLKYGDVVEKDSLGQFVHNKSCTIFDIYDVTTFPKHWELVEEPIFISDDGKMMYEGDTYYVPQIGFASELSGNYVSFLVEKESQIKTKHGRFSTIATVEKHIEIYSKKYSLREIEEVYNAKKYALMDYDTLYKTLTK